MEIHPIITAACLVVSSAHGQMTPAHWKFAPAPLMGWNSWDCFGTTITEEQKIGIHVMSGISRQAVKEHSPNPGTNVRTAAQPRPSVGV